MSLEQALQENTAAVKELAAMLLAHTNNLKTISEKFTHADNSDAVATATDKKVETKKEDKKPETKKPTAENASSAKDATQKTSDQTDNAKPLSYDDIKTPFMRILKDKGEAPARAVLEEIGAKTLKDVPEADWQKAYDILVAKEKELFDNEDLA